MYFAFTFYFLLHYSAWNDNVGTGEMGNSIFVIAALVGAGGSAMLICSLSIIAELVGDNAESGAFVYGLMSFTDKLSTG